MTEQQHPITPPPELIRKWDKEAATVPMADQYYIATQAARWGADQELDACVKWLRNDPVTHEIIGREARHLDFDLYDARRPKPPSLAEQALEAHERMWIGGTTDADWALIRVALERLKELESNG